MWKKVCNLIGICLLCSAWTHGSSSAPHTGFSTFKIGAGGAIRHLDIGSDGTKVISTDVYGVYVCPAPCTSPNFQQAINATSIPTPATFQGPLGFQAGSSLSAGAYDIRIAPSNTQIFYMMWNGLTWRTANQGVSWTNLGLTQDTNADPNNNNASLNRRIAIAPSHPNSVIVCGPTIKCNISINANLGGSSTWAALPSITTATAGFGYIVAYDPNDATDNTAYVASYGAGVFKCTALQTSPACAAAGTGSPITFQFMLVDASGNLWETDQAVNSACGNVNELPHGSSIWSVSLSTSSACAEQLAVNGSLLYAIANNANQLFVRVSGTWSAANTNGATAGTDIPWLVAFQNTIVSPPFGLYANDAAFDPNTGLLYAAAGLGVWQTNPPVTTSTVTITWTDFSVAIEELVANWIISPPSGTPIFAGWDQGVFDNPNGLTSYALTNPAGGVTANHTAWGVDWCTSSPNINPTLVTNNGLDNSGVLNNSAGTYAKFATSPVAHGLGGDLGGGSIACQTSSNICAVGNDNSFEGNTIVCTPDGGTTWAGATYAGTAPNTGTGQCSGWGGNVARRLIADRGGTNFYAYNDGNTGSGCILGAAGMWRSTDGGVHWGNALPGQLCSGFTNNSQMRAVPTQSKDYFFTCGVSGLTPSTATLFECVDPAGTLACNSLSSVGVVYAVGFGKVKPGNTYPVIFIFGNVTLNSGVSYTLGLWESDDHGATWTLISQYPNNSIDWVKTVEGDPAVYGRVYVGFNGSGMTQYN